MVTRLHPDWLYLRTEVEFPQAVAGNFFGVFGLQSVRLRHKTISNILAVWEADSDAEVRLLQPDGTLVASQANGQVCILKLYHGNRRVSLAEVEDFLSHPTQQVL
jgi:hypothetical protein